ncbi:small integral membrane protein 4 [Neocloeon triangulifer]|uniref:small integral membrane protein 4 n=1 Tax=Neocloeon triangulifer TaxID=2078957 RepID=UPI00286F29E1|nr:small integral membrane protein 4 [Neocloeon triangulifer]
MQLYNRGLQKLLDKWPGKKTFGIYRFLPLFFALGAALEFSMINWTVGETNFYRTYKRRQVQELADEIILKAKKEKA